MDRFVFFMVLYFFSTSISAQNQKPKKTELAKLFRKSIEQNSRKSILAISNPWIIDNEDSLYYKADSVRLINFKKAISQNTFCQVVNWTFYRKDKFQLVESQNCQEPTSGKISRQNNAFRIKIRRTEIGLTLTTINLIQSSLVDQFLVISISQDEIVLKRLKKRVFNLKEV